MSKINTYYYLIIAVIALFGPNAIYLYGSITNPDLNLLALKNPVSLAFMIEAMMLLGIFLVYVYKRTKSYPQVGIYLVLSFLGSLAFSFPLFLYLNRSQKT